MMQKFAVCILIENSEGKYLSVSRKGDHETFGLPGGKVDKEDFEGLEFLDGIWTGAKREFLEEVEVNLNSVSENSVNIVFEQSDASGYYTFTFEIPFSQVSRELEKCPFINKENSLVQWVDRKDLTGSKNCFAQYNINLFDKIDHDLYDFGL